MQVTVEDWPGSELAHADLPLHLSRGTIVDVQAIGFPPGGEGPIDLKPEQGLTRLRLHRPPDARIDRVQLTIMQEGEPRLGPHATWLDPVDKPLNALARQDQDAYLNCRRSHASGTDAVARARKFFLAIDERTTIGGPCVANHDALTDALELLTYRMRQRVDYKKAKPDVHIDPDAIPLITDIFDASSPYGPNEPDTELDAYLWFAAGRLEHACPFTDVAAGPNSGNVLLFTELAFASLERSKSKYADYWCARLPTLVLMQELFRRRFDTVPRTWRALGPYDGRRTLCLQEVNDAKRDFLPLCEKDPEGTSNKIIHETVLSMPKVL